MCMTDGTDPYTVYNWPRATRAAKTHKCTECGRVIEKGETYYPASGLYEGSWDTHHTCAHCHVACEWLIENCDGFLHHGVAEDILEHAHEYNRPDLKRLFYKMQGKWTLGGKLRAIPARPRPIRLGDAKVVA